MEFFAYIASLNLAASDWAFFALALPVGWFLIRYGLMTKWWVDPLGWFVLLMAVSFGLLLVLIGYAVFTGQRVDEVWRFLIMVSLFVAWVGKVFVLERERRAGRIAKRALIHTGSNPTIQGEVMTDTTLAPVVPEIWYKGKRVLRTLVQVGIPAFLATALVIPQIIEALGLPADSELRLWLLAVAAGVTAVAAAITRIMAIPGVNSFLTKFLGLGSVPKGALIATTITDNGNPVAVITSVEPDPKVLGA